MLAGVERAEQVFHPRLRRGGFPAQRRHLVHAHLLALHHELAAVDVGLQHRHRAVIEKERVVVVGRAAEQFDVERALALLQAEALFDRLAACCTPTWKLSKVA